MPDERVLGAGTTSVMTAKMRALESARSEPLIVDRFAQQFVDASGLDYGTVSLSAVTGQRLFESNVIRTWWLDREVESALDGGCSQVVVLAGGLDSRAARLDGSGKCQWFEVETAALSSFKREVLEADGIDMGSWWTQVEGTPADLAWSEDLIGAGFEPGLATCWVAEGMFYLAEMEGTAVLEEAARLSGPGSRFAIAHFGNGSLVEAQTREMSNEARDHSGRGFQSVVAAPLSWLESGGWSLQQAQSIASVGRTLGREVVYSAPEEIGNEYTWLISARR